MELQKEIIAGQGVGEIKFGITKEDLKKLVGQASDIDADDEIESWHYDELALSAAFDKEEDWRLISVAVSSPEYTYNGETLLGITPEELVAKLENIGIDELEYEDVSENEFLISAEQIGINFWVEDKEVTEIQWSVGFDEETETVAWPK